MYNKLLSKLKLFRGKPNTSMSLQIIAFIAARNLLSKRLRSSLTIIGVMVGVGAIHFLLTLGLGLQNLVTQQIVGNSSVKIVDVTTPNSEIIKLNDKTANQLANIANVDSVSRISTGVGTIKSDSNSSDLVVYGVDNAYKDLTEIHMSKGKWFESANPGSQAIISAAALRTINKNADDIIGQQMNLALQIDAEANKPKKIQEDVTIVGVTNNESSSELFVQSSIFAKAEVDKYTQLKLQVNSTDKIDDVRKNIEALGLETTSPLDTIAQIQQLFKYVNAGLVLFGAIGMFIAILGMFNTLTVALLERTKEISLMLTLGVRNRDIMRLFLYESILLSFIGAIFGIALSTLMGIVLNVVMNGISSGRGITERFSVVSSPWWLPLLSILFMTFIGVVIAIFPAKRAASISPVDSLRDE
ncbi:ABC transporter permease [bacterium]|nr:ABC transporter permease [bacterium]